MGSSAKQENFVFEGHWSIFWIKMQFGIRHPPNLYINCSLHVWGRGQGSVIFKRNSIILIRSKVMAFLVILLSPHCPYVVPIVPTSSPCRPHHPHVVPIAPRRSQCGLHGCGLRGLRCLHPMLSPWPPYCPRCPHVIPVIPTSSQCCPCHPHIVPIAPEGSHVVSMAVVSVVSVVSTPCCPRGLHVIPIVPTSSLCHPRHPHIISNPPDSPLHPPIPPGGRGAPNQ